MSTYKVKWYNVAAVPLLAAILGAVAAVNTARVGGTTTLLAGASAVAVVGAAITLWIRARLGARVTVDADGLGFRGRWTWDRVLWTSYGTRIRIWRDGVPSELAMTSVESPRALVAAMDRAGSAHVEARFAAAIAGGPPVTWRRLGFGELRVDQTGVSDGKRTIPWDDMALLDGHLLAKRSAGRVERALGVIDLGPANLPCPDVVLAALERRQPRLREAL